MGMAVKGLNKGGGGVSFRAVRNIIMATVGAQLGLCMGKETGSPR